MPAESLSDPAVSGGRRPDPPPGPRLTNCSACFDQVPGYRTLRPAGAGSWLLTLTLEGRGFFRQAGGSEFIVGAGDVVLLEPTAYSDYGTHEGRWRFHWCHFQPLNGWEDRLILQRAGEGHHRAAITSLDTRQRLDRTFQRLHGDLLGGGPFATDLALTALGEILLLINRDMDQRQVLDSRVARALTTIHQSPAASHTVETLAHQAGLSPSRFAHLFRQEVGDSIMQTVHNVRLRQARRLLATTEEPIALIAQTVGYNSPHYFSRHFKENLGLSPSEYREGQSTQRR